MQRASSLFSEADRQRINDCIRTVESGSSAEIVPVVTTISGRYDRAEDLAGLWLGVLLMIAVSVLWPPSGAPVESGSWGPDPVVMQTVKLIVTMIVGFILGAIIATRVGWLRRLFTPVVQMSEEVQQAAQAVFYDQRVHHTHAGNGLLIYISLFEHMAVILADRQTLAAVGQPAIDDLCRSLTQQLRSGNLTDALCSTIQSAGHRLRTVMPGQHDDVNELPDCLVTID